MANGTGAPPRRVESAEETYEQFGVLRQRVSGIEQSIASLAQQVSALGSKLDDRGRTPWAQLISGAALVVGIMTTIGMMAYWPIRENQTRFDESIAKLADRTAAAVDSIQHSYLTNKEHDVFVAGLADQKKDILESITRRFERLEANDNRMLAEIVPRVEHEKDWTSQRDRDADLQRQISNLQAALTSLSSPADAMKDMRETIAELQRRVWALPPPPGK